MNSLRPCALLLTLAVFGAGCQAAIPEPVVSPTPSSSIGSSSCESFTDIYQALQHASDVCTLDVSGQRLTGALPAEIRHLTKLQTLNARNNDMTGIPAEIGQLNDLRDLDYGSNRLDTMPNEIAHLTGLQTLSLAHNTYRSVPDSVVQLKQLKTLDLTGNPLSADEVARVKAAMPNTAVVF